MLQRSTIDFLKKLKKNNNRDWFNQNKELYNIAFEFQQFNFRVVFGITFGSHF